MSSDNKRKLYDALSQDYDMGSFEQFCEDIKDDSKRKKLYDATSSEYDYGDYETFSSQLMGTPKPQSQQQKEQEAQEVEQKPLPKAERKTLQEQAGMNIAVPDAIDMAAKFAEGQMYDPNANIQKALARGELDTIINQDEEQRISTEFTPKPVVEASDIYKNYYDRFGLTERGKQLSGELATIQAGVQKKYADEFLASDDYKKLSETYTGEQLDEAANTLFAEKYSGKIEEELKPYYDAYRNEALSRYQNEIGQEVEQFQKAQTAKTKDEIAADVSSLTSSIAQQKEDIHNRLSSKAGTGGNAMSAIMGSRKYIQETEADRKAQAELDAAQQLMDESNNIIAEAKKKGKTNFVAGLGRGLSDAIFDANTWSFGLQELRDNTLLLNALNKYDNGEQLTESEQTLMDAAVANMATNAYFYSDLGRGYKAGTVSGQSIPFMLEFAINPVSASGSAIAKSILKYGMQKFGKSAVKNNASKFAARLIGDMAAAGLMTGTTSAARVGAGAVERMTGDIQLDDTGTEYAGRENVMSAGEAVGKSAASTFLENQSEMVFNAFKGLGNKIWKTVENQMPGGIAGVMDNAILGKVGDIYRKAKSNPVLQEVARRTQFHGLAEEYLEEVYNNFANIPLGEMTLEEATDLDNNIDTFLGLAPTSVAFAALGLGGLAMEKNEHRKRIKAALGNLTRIESKRLAELEKMAETAGNEDIKRFIRETITSTELTPEEKKAEIDYAYNLAVGNAIDQLETEQKNETLENHAAATEEGRAIYAEHNPQTMRETVLRREIAEQRLAATGMTQDDISMLANTPVEDRYNAISSFDTDRRKAAENYFAAKDRETALNDALDEAHAEEVTQARELLDSIMLPNGTVTIVPLGASATSDTEYGVVVSGIDAEGNPTQSNGAVMVYPVKLNNGQLDVDFQTPMTIVPKSYTDAMIYSPDEALEGMLKSYSDDAAILDGIPMTVGAQFPIMDDNGMMSNVTILGIDQQNGRYIVSLNNVIDKNGVPKNTYIDAAELAERKKNAELAPFMQEQIAEEQQRMEAEHEAITTDLAPQVANLQPQPGEKIMIAGKQAAIKEIAPDGLIVDYINESGDITGTDIVPLDAYYNYKQEQFNAQEEKVIDISDVSEQSGNINDTEKNAGEQPSEPQGKAEQPYPTDESGEPAFTQMQPEQTISLLTSTLADDAASFVTDKLSEAEKSAKKAAEKKPKSLSFTERVNELGKIAEEKAKAESELQYWQNISAMMNVQPAQPAAKKEEPKKPQPQAKSITEEAEEITRKNQERLAAMTDEQIAAAQKKVQENIDKGKYDRPTQRKRIRYAEQDRDMGYAVTPYEHVLREIATGAVTFKWSDMGATQGLGSHLGVSGSVAERQKLIWALSNDGYAPEVAAEVIHANMPENLQGMVTDQDIFNMILDAFGTYGSPSKMFEAAKEMHGTDEISMQRGYEEDMERQLLEWEAEQNKMSMDEWTTYLDVVEDVVEMKFGTLSDEDINTIFDGIINEINNENQRRETEGRSSETTEQPGDTETGNEVLSGQQADNTTAGTESAEQKQQTETDEQSSSTLSHQGFTVEKRYHKKDNKDIFAVNFTERMDRDIFLDAKREAKNKGGYYSSFGKGGFIFETEETARNFGELIMAGIVGRNVGKAIEAARAQVEPNPTEAQKEAGNYKKGHVTVDGYNITLENPKGSERSGTDKDGKAWSVTMNNDYGYIRGTEGVDGDHIDVFLSDTPESGNVYVVDQVNEDGSFDEHKVMYGFDTRADAEEAYLANYSAGWKGLGNITEVSKEQFKKWIESSHRKTKPFAEYKSMITPKKPDEVNGYKKGDKVMYNGKPAIIHDFEYDGRPVLDTGLAPVLYEVVDWETVSRIPDIVKTPQTPIQAKKELLDSKIEKRQQELDDIMSGRTEDFVYGNGGHRSDLLKSRIGEWERDKRNLEVLEALKFDVPYEGENGMVFTIKSEENGEYKYKVDSDGYSLDMSTDLNGMISTINRYDLRPDRIAQQLQKPQKGKKTGTAKTKTAKDKGAQAVQETPEYGSQNKVVSTARYEELKKRMRAKLNNLNAGYDPELIAIGAEMAAYHVEAGARKFVDFAKRMISDIGEDIRPYLKLLYNSARDFPGMEEYKKSMTPYDEVDKTNINDIKLTEDEQTAEVKPSAPVKKAPSKGNMQKTDNAAGFGDLFSGVNEVSLQTETLNRTDNEQKRGSETENTGVGETARQEDGRADRSGMDKSSTGSVGTEQPGSGRNVGISSGESTGSTAGKTEPQIKNTRNNRNERGIDYAPRSPKARYAANVKAIKLMRQLMNSGEQATKEQMEVLRRYSGWGGMGTYFNNTDTEENKQLRELLTDEEYDAAANSGNSAYYTPAQITDSLWDIVEKLGFKGGNILEGSAGIGNILGAMTQSISEKSNIHAVEIDKTSGNILSLLYPDAKVDIQGFEDTRIRNGSVDLAITNVPFVADLTVYDKIDKDLSAKFPKIQDFCIAKNVRKLREGGLGVFITSSITMDNSANLREWLVNEGNADFIGAFRLNNKTFEGADVTTDIIVVRKRTGKKVSPVAIDALKSTVERTGSYETKETEWNKKERRWEPVKKDVVLEYNTYYQQHPENMGGEMFFGYEKGNTYRPGTQGLYPVAGKNQNELLKNWVNSFTPIMDASYQPQQVQEVETEEKNGTLFADKEGNFFISDMGVGVPLNLNANKIKGYEKTECLNDYNAIKTSLNDVLEYQINNQDDKGLQPLLDKLNEAYDTFVGKYGSLNKNTAISFLKNDVDFPSIAALEDYKEYKNAQEEKVIDIRKTNVFDGRVIGFQTEPEPKDVKDGVIASIYKNGYIDVPYIAEKLGKSVEQVEAEILKEKIGFVNPVSGAIEVRYEYLSGNVRQKLEEAKANNTNGEYNTNIAELEKVIPMDIPAHLIDFSLGSSWIDPKLYIEYIQDRYGVSGVSLNHVEGAWNLTVRGGVFNEKNRAAGVYSEMFKETIYATDLVAAALNNRTVQVKKVIKGDKTKETLYDREATQACVQRIEEIKDDFKEWMRNRLQQDEELAAQVTRTYNDKFNNMVPKEIDDMFLPERFGGASQFVNLYTHQKRAVIKGTTQPLLLAHEVGSGKTFTLISTAMEMRRLGTAKKPMIVVQNATVAQFVADAKKVYPNAKVLTITERDRTPEGRRAFYGRIKYSDWDMIIIPQSTFEMIPDSPERQLTFIQERIEEKQHAIEMMQETGVDENQLMQAERELENIQIEMAKLTERLRSGEGPAPKTKKKDAKREEKVKQNVAARAKKQLDRRTDEVQYFDEMGVDAILIDEAHEYKRLGFSTAMTRGVKGIDPAGSKKAAGVYLKTRAVLEKNGWKNVVFATGTPISNTAAEIWTFMRYLMPKDVLKANEIYYFDDFVRNFGSISQSLEFTTSGKFKENTRFASYINKPELIRLWATVSDTVLTKEIGYVNSKIPSLEKGIHQDVFLPQSDSLISIMNAVRARLEEFEKMSGKEKRKNSHIPLTMYGIAKRAAIDTRLVDANAPDEPLSKTNKAVEETLKSLEETKDYKGTVAIFCDNQRRWDGPRVGFDLFEDIKTKLIEKGVSENQIVIMKPGMSIQKKQKIFDDVNAGTVRVVIGNTQTLGTGVNIQERLHTLIHMDAPDRPMDYTQRNGRILRQGNLHKVWNKPVRILRFGVEDSLDVTSYQRLKTKAAFIDSIMDGKSALANNQENRTLEEEEEGLFDNPVAILSGSQYALLKNAAERELRKYVNNKKRWEADQIYVVNRLARNKGLTVKAQQSIDENEQQLAKVKALFPDGKVNTLTYNKKKLTTAESVDEAFKEINKAVKAMDETARKDRYFPDTTLPFEMELDGNKLVMKVTLSRSEEYDYKQKATLIKVRRNLSFDMPAMDIKDYSVMGAYARNILEYVEENIVTGTEFTDVIEVQQASIEAMAEESKLLEQRKGKPFEFDKELEEAQKKVDEYTELMKAEMKEKEAKYAGRGSKNVDLSTIESEEEQDEAQTDDEVRFRIEDEYTEENSNEIRFRDVTEQEELNWLNNQPTIKAYRAMQVIDGKLYPPMMAAVQGKLVSPRELGTWEVADERPDIIKFTKTNKQGEEIGYVDLDKGTKDATGKKATITKDVAYNPYWHTSRSPLNDQFKSAWIRPNLVTVEVEIPESELSSGYRAQYSKNPVGEAEWKAGSVSSKLAKIGKPRKVILSRWDKPIRIVPESEVADKIKKLLEGTDIEIPENVVTPKLRQELEKVGVKIGLPEKGVSKTAQIEEALQKGLSIDNSLVNVRYRTIDDVQENELSDKLSRLIYRTPVKSDPFYNVNNVNLILYNMSGPYMRRLPKPGERHVLTEGNIDIEHAKNVYKKIRPVLNELKKELISMIPDATIPARKEIASYIHAIDNNISYYKELSEGKDVWRTRPLYRFVQEQQEVSRYQPVIDAIQAEAGKLGIKVNVYTSMDEVPAGAARRAIEKGLRVKGWYQNRQINIYLPNAAGMEDVKATLLHEGVAHYGLRQLVGEQNFNEFIGKLYAQASKEVRENVMKLAPKYGYNIYEAMEEYIASMAEKGIDNPTFWQTVKKLFRDMFEKIGIKLDITDNDLRYLLWESRNNLRESANPISVAKETTMRKKLGIGMFGKEPAEETRFRFEDRPQIIQQYDETIKSNAFRFQEAFQDSMLSLKELQTLIESYSGKKIRTFENAYTAENRLSSVNKQDNEKYMKKYFEPLVEHIKKLSGSASREEVEDYIYAKSGLERNEVFLKRDADKAFNESKKELDAKLDKGDLTQDQYDALIKIAEADYQKAMSEPRDYSGLEGLVLKARQDELEGLDEKERAKKEKEIAKEYKQHAENVVSEFEAKIPASETARLWQLINDATNETLRIQFDSGMISGERYDELKGMMKYYVPLKSWSEQIAEDVYEYTRREAPVQKEKAAKGRKSLAANPIANIALSAQNAIILGNRNKMKQRFFNFVINRPNPLATVSDVWYAKTIHTVHDQVEPVYPDINETDGAEEIQQKLEDFENEMKELEERGMAFRRKVPMGVELVMKKFQKPEHMVQVMINGQEYVIYINGNPRAAQAINGKTNPEGEENIFWEYYNKAKRLYGGGLTSNNPDFVIANFVRDSIHSATMEFMNNGLVASLNYLKNVPSSVKTVSRGVTGIYDSSNQMDVYFKEFVENGGETGYTAIHTLEDYKKEYEKLLQEVKGTRKALKAGKKSLDAVISVLETANRIAEDVNRFNAYVSSRQAGKTIEESVDAAKNITVNFNKKGSLSKGSGAWAALAWFMNKWILFFNPAVQGLYQVGQAAKKNKRRVQGTLGAVMASGFIMPYINSLLISAFGGGDDDDYFNQTDYTRMNNWLLFTGDGYVKIPLPPFFREWYGLGDILYRMLTDRMTPEKATVATARQLQSLIGFINLIPSGEPSIAEAVAGVMPDLVAPLMDVALNRDFTGRDIAKDAEYTKNLPEYERIYKGVSPVYVSVSRMLNEIGGDEARRSPYFGTFINPAYMEHLVTSYTGGIGKTISNVVGMAADAVTGETDNIEFRTVPVANRFYAPVTDRTVTSAINRIFYEYQDRYEAARVAEKRYKEFIKDGRKEFRKELEQMKKNGEADFISYFGAKMKILRKKQDRLKENPDDKRLEEEIRELKSQMIMRSKKLLE